MINMLQALVFFERDDLVGAESQEEFILKFLIKHKIHGGTVVRGHAGFGANHSLKRPEALFSFDEVPMIIIFIDEEKKVLEIIPKLKAAVKNCQIFTSPVTKW